MIVLEITEEAGQSHYDLLGITKDALTSAKEAAKAVRDAAKRVKREHQAAAQRGDRDAEDKLIRINRAETCLKDPEKRAEYDKGLEGEQGGMLEVLRIHPVSPPFFNDRGVRFRTIERLMREAGLLGADA